MEQADIVDSASGKVLAKGIGFVRLPAVSEVIATGNGGWSHVMAVLHSWTQGNPVAAIVIDTPAPHPLAGSIAAESWATGG